MVTVLDGTQVAVSSEHIVSLYPTKEGAPVPRSQSNTLVAKGGRCVVGLSDGRHLTVREDCVELRKRLETAR